MDATIRSLGSNEWELWRDLRLRALGDNPDAFRSTLEYESSLPEAWWVDLIAGTPDGIQHSSWIAETDQGMVGMLASTVDPVTRVMTLWAMWVDPNARGHHIASKLFETALAWGRDHGVRMAELWVNQGNSEARTLYRRAGFRPTTETEPLRPGSPHIVIKMTMSL